MFIGPTRSARAFNRYRWSNDAKLRPAILFVSLRGALFSSRQGRRRRVVGYASSLEVSGPEQMPKPVRSEAIASTVSCTSVATSSAAGIARDNRTASPAHCAAKAELPWALAAALSALAALKAIG